MSMPMASAISEMKGQAWLSPISRTNPIISRYCPGGSKIDTEWRIGIGGSIGGNMGKRESGIWFMDASVTRGQRFMTVHLFFKVVSSPFLGTKLCFQFGNMILLEIRQHLQTSNLSLTGISGAFPGNIGGLSNDVSTTHQHPQPDSPHADEWSPSC